MQTDISISGMPIVGLATVTVVLICIIFVLLCLLMALYILKKLQARNIAGKASLEEKVNEARSQELEWYREKRFLMESQAREKQARLGELINSIAPENSHELTYAATRLFFLAESIREERQHLGTDLSKLSLIDRRLRKLGKECIKQTGKGERTEKWLSKMSLCRQMIQSNREDLRKSQNLLRNILGEVTALEEKARNNELDQSALADAVETLEDCRNKLSDLPDGLRTVAKSTGEQAQNLFRESTAHIPEEELHSVWKEQTAMDLFSSKNRPGGRSELLQAADDAIKALQGKPVAEKAPEKPAEPVSEPKEIEPEPKPEPKEDPIDIPDFAPPAGEKPKEEPPAIEKTESLLEKETANAPVWATPADFGLDSSSKKQPKEQGLFQPFSAPKENQTDDDGSSLMIFRSANPEIWNTTVNNGDDDRAIAINEITGNVSWMGIKRLDNEEQVFCEISLSDLKSNGEGKPSGFNGSNEFFYGARHLGFFSEECPTEVETLFTYGGWGFGHLSTSDGEEARQYCGWAGKRIPEGTIFEITLYEEKPEGVNDDQIIL